MRDRYQLVAEANRQFYEKTAARYDSTESHLSNASSQRELERDLDQILEMLRSQGTSRPRALDACAGTGTVTLKLLRAGVDTVSCDISPDMLAILEQKANAEALAAKLHLGEIRDYLETREGQFDLITFSSALHHLEDYRGVLFACAARLAPGGMIYTTFDPALSADISRVGRWLQLCDYATFKLTQHPLDVPFALARRLRRAIRSGDEPALDSATVGALAEFHVEHGLDDRALANELRQLGLSIVWHRREADARFTLPRLALRALGDVTTFSLLVRRP